MKTLREIVEQYGLPVRVRDYGNLLQPCFQFIEQQEDGSYAGIMYHKGGLEARISAPANSIHFTVEGNGK